MNDTVKRSQLKQYWNYNDKISFQFSESSSSLSSTLGEHCEYKILVI